MQIDTDKLTILDELKNKLLATQHIKDNLQKQQLSIIKSIDDTNMELQKINLQIKGIIANVN